MKDLTHVKTAYTHGSVFHADDVFAAALLRLCGGDIEIIRTNDGNLAAELDKEEDILVFDIGLGEYDHHQSDKSSRPVSDGTYIDKDGKEKPIPYCSFGMLWRDYGRELCPSDIAWKKVDRDLVLPIDKCDNGIARNTLSGMIGMFNPNWDESCTEEARLHNFEWAVDIALVILCKYVAAANSLNHAAQKINELSTVVDGDILVLDQYMPWQDVVIETMPEIKFVIFPSSRNMGRYNVQTVPVEAGSFIGRKLFPTEWLGKTDDKLGITFCHTGNFLLEAVDLQHALECAKIAI